VYLSYPNSKGIKEIKHKQTNNQNTKQPRFPTPSLYYLAQYSAIAIRIHLSPSSVLIMGLHLPSALVGSAFAGCGFLLIHRELSHRHRLTTKWELQEYAEEQWKEWRKSAVDPISDSAQVRKSLLLIGKNGFCYIGFTSWKKSYSVRNENNHHMKAKCFFD
jgi:hypothetical protein